MVSQPLSLRRRARVIELFGLPGAGKTTVTNRLVLHAGGLRRGDLTRARKALSHGQFAHLLLRTLLDVRWLWALVHLAIRTPIWRPESIDRLGRIAATRTWIKSQGELIVLDQGALQGLWSIFFTEGRSKPPREALCRVLAMLYADVDVVLVDIAIQPEIAAKRVTMRPSGNSRLDNLPIDTIRTKLRHIDELPKELLAAARQAGLRVVSLSGENDIASLTSRTQALVDDFANAAKP